MLKTKNRELVLTCIEAAKKIKRQYKFLSKEVAAKMAVSDNKGPSNLYRTVLKGWNLSPAKIGAVRETMVDQLKNVRRILENGWTKNSNAVDFDGNEVDFNSKKACRFCLAGAIFKAAHAKENDCGIPLYQFVRSVVLKHKPVESIEGFNDSSKTTLDNVLQIVDKAIEECKENNGVAS